MKYSSEAAVVQQRSSHLATWSLEGCCPQEEPGAELLSVEAISSRDICVIFLLLRGGQTISICLRSAALMCQMSKKKLPGLFCKKDVEV